MMQYILLIANFFVVVLGGLVAAVCLKGYRQNRSFSMLCLTIGFSLIAAASITGAVLLGFPGSGGVEIDEACVGAASTTGAVLLGFLGIGFWEIQSIQATMTAFGFAYIVHSIFTKRK